jgi:hypothetical protein
MATEGLSPQGLKRYQRWLAVQRAKGRVPSQSEVSAFLQGELEASVSTANQSTLLALAKEKNVLAAKQFKMEKKAYKDQSDAAKLAGLGEVVKLGVGVNELTGGLLTEGLAKGFDFAASAASGLFGGASSAAPSAAVGGASAASYGLDDLASDLWGAVTGK